MANLCMTQFTFEGNKEEIRKLYDLILHSSEDMSAYGYCTWLGSVLIAAGLPNPADDNYKGPECRGSVEYLSEIEDVGDPEDNKTRFELETETKWVPMGKMWQAIIEKLGLFGVHFAYLAEEPGCRIYQKYDPYELLDTNADEWYLDYYLEDSPKLNTTVLDNANGDKYMSTSEMIATVQGLFNTQEEDIASLVDMVNTYKPSGEYDFITLVHLNEIYDLVD